jgi:hypothetical protein
VGPNYDDATAAAAAVPVAILPIPACGSYFRLLSKNGQSADVRRCKPVMMQTSVAAKSRGLPGSSDMATSSDAGHSGFKVSYSEADHLEDEHGVIAGASYLGQRWRGRWLFPDR